jgi:NTE family protein
MDADLVLEGGGVKGIALAGAISTLQEAGYRFHRVAGTSAGAIVGALVAAGITSPDLVELLEKVRIADFRDESLIDRLGPLGKGMSLLFDKGIYEGKELREWLAGELESLGVRTFADLRITDDPASALTPDRAYKLVVIASDVSRGRLVRFPWDYPRYDLDPDEQAVADAVRASMSIPFFFEPVVLRDAATGEDSYLVDGGILSNFPVDTFDRTDGRPPRWPTFGIKLSARPDASQTPNRIRNTLDFTRAIIGTMANAHDQRHLDDPCVVVRTIFVDAGTVKSTDFDLPPETQRMLFENGRRAAAEFLETWDFDGYVERCRTPA